MAIKKHGDTSTFRKKIYLSPLSDSQLQVQVYFFPDNLVLSDLCHNTEEKICRCYLATSSKMKDSRLHHIILVFISYFLKYRLFKSNM